jgi:hypothetical protein
LSDINLNCFDIKEREERIGREITIGRKNKTELERNTGASKERNKVYELTE